ncbi:sirohydrochlorin chelatase [Streptomyces sp. NPDC001678]|uniref:sirohydrochlorin chelatase n=1 Tax=Streptomyces sp. NPDC001678 TaxID=3364599 RepID=UPI0036A4EC07
MDGYEALPPRIPGPAAHRLPDTGPAARRPGVPAGGRDRRDGPAASAYRTLAPPARGERGRPAADAPDGPGPVLVAAAHGTRDPAGVRTVRRLLERVRAARPGLRVECGFLGPASPSLPDVLGRVAGPVVVVPVLLGPGYHVRVDIPAVLAAAGAGHRAVTAPALGPDPLLAEALCGRLREAGWHGRVPDHGRVPGGAVVLTAAGSRDPAATAATRAMAGLLSARLGAPVVPAHLGGPLPPPAEAVAALRGRGRPGPVAVAPYLLAPGDFARRAGPGCGADAVAAPLGAHPAVAHLVLRRYDEARLRGARPARAADHGSPTGR